MNPTIGKWVRVRVGLVGLGLALLGLVICGRFFYLQVVLGPQLREEATREYQKTCPVLPVRGAILDRRGQELAISTRVSSVVAHPTQIKHAERLSRELAPILGFKPKELKDDAHPGQFFYLDQAPPHPGAGGGLHGLGRGRGRARPRPPRSPGAGIRTPSICCPRPNATIRSSPWPGRSWDFATSTAMVWKGWSTSLTATLWQTQAVLEDDGRPGPYRLLGEKAWDPEVMGNNVVLTLDRTLQYIAEKELARGVEKYHAAGGLALVVQPQTGEILAMAQLPSMDPNRYVQFPEVARRNRLLTDALEPGSTYKIFIAATALDANVVKPTDTLPLRKRHLAYRRQGSDPRCASLRDPDGAAGHSEIQQYRRRQDRQQGGRSPPGSVSPGLRLRPQKRHPVPRGEQRPAEKSPDRPVRHRPGHRGLRPGGLRHRPCR